MLTLIYWLLSLTGCPTPGTLEECPITDPTIYP